MVIRRTTETVDGQAIVLYGKDADHLKKYIASTDAAGNEVYLPFNEPDDIQAVCTLTYVAKERETKNGKHIPEKTVFTEIEKKLVQLKDGAVLGLHTVKMADGTVRKYFAHWRKNWLGWKRDKMLADPETVKGLLELAKDIAI